MTGLELRQRSSRYMPVGVQKDVYIDPMRTFCVEEQKQARCDHNSIEYEDSSGNLHCRSCEYGLYFSDEFQRGACCSGVAETIEIKERGGYMACCGGSGPYHGYYFYDYDSNHGLCCDGKEVVIPYTQDNNFACCGGLGEFYGYEHSIYGNYGCCEETYGSGAYVETVVVPPDPDNDTEAPSDICCGSENTADLWGYQYFLDGGFQCCEGSKETVTLSECCDASGTKDTSAEFEYVDNFEKACCSGITGDELDGMIERDKYVCCGVVTKEHGECCAGSVFKYDPDEAIAVRCGRNAKEIKDSAMDTFTCVAA